MSEPFLITQDFTRDFEKIIKSFKRDAVLVGIPEADATREEDAPINNAALLAINEFGSPVNNIRPRPVMAIGIKNAQEAIAEQFKRGVTDAFSRGVSALSVVYNRVGLIASNSVKKAINAQEGFDKPADATIAARRAAGFKGIKALIVTGQLRNSITYVVKGEE